jgi:CHAT domain-containing protein
LSDPPRGASTRSVDALLTSVGRLVIEPLGPIPTDTRLVFVPDGSLHFTPFAALPEPARSDARAPYLPLVEGHEIAVLPSMTAFSIAREARARRARPPLAAAVFADPVYDARDPRVRRAPAVAASAPSTPLLRAIDDLADARTGNPFGRLAFSRDEAGTIGSLAPPPTFRALDFAATRSAAMSPSLGRHRIVHFATHAVLNAIHPELSGIVLSLVDQQGRPQDGFLRLHDIYAMRLPVDLVVLSACQTALGREVKSEGLIGLTRGFIYAGAASIVGSLWKVDDQATSVLMQRFYEGLFRRGLHPAAALRAAQRALASDDQWSAPYHWSGFFLQGEFSPAEWN